MSDLRVFKYALSFSEPADVLMPLSAKILHVDSHNGVPCIWALVEAEEQPTPRRFYIRGTGQPIAKEFSYVATFQVPPFVWHLFEV